MSRRRIASAKPQSSIHSADHRLSERATSYYLVTTQARIQPDGSVQLQRSHTIEGIQGAFRLTPAEVVRFAPILTQLAQHLQEVPACR